MHNKLGRFVKCLICKKEFYCKPYQLSKRKFCSHKCYWASKKGKKLFHKAVFKKGHIPHNKGLKGFMAREKNGMWKNGKQFFGGYVFLLMPEHPYNIKGYIREHRYMAECILGRFLESEEVVHHINGIKDNNHPENLYLFSSESEHQKYGHYIQRNCKGQFTNKSKILLLKSNL